MLADRGTGRISAPTRREAQPGYDEFLAPGFTASLPDYKIYDRKAFLDMIAKPSVRCACSTAM